MVLLGSNLLFALMYFQTAKELEGAKTIISSQRYNDLDIKFLKMFIKQVIKSTKEVDFDTRLKLENSVRELNDPQLLAQWQKFVASQAHNPPVVLINGQSDGQKFGPQD